jgi:hypothetical protein
MTNNWLRGLALAAGLAAAGVWLWQASGDPVQVLAALTVALTAVVGAFWQSRVESARRVRVLDAYVERALARERGRGPRKTPAVAKASSDKPFTTRVA